MSKRETSEEVVKFFGQSFSHSEYRLAKRHNRLRWIAAMGVGIPVFVFTLVTLGMLYTMVISSFVLPAIYTAATQFFPGSKKYGTPLYKRFEQYLVLEKGRKQLSANND